MKVAFYAPMKPPAHPIPSGDRHMARMLIDALRLAGHDVTLASRFRTWDRDGDVVRQERLRDVGCKLAQRATRRFRHQQSSPDIWFTYHLYHKAPDWIGPAVSANLGIPYLIAEASFAPKQSTGPWRIGHDQAKAALHQAAAVIAFNRRDIAGITPLLAEAAALVTMRPFINMQGITHHDAADRVQIARQLSLDADRPWLITVAMMRFGDKLASYRQLGRSLERMTDMDWQLVVVGDGEARHAVEAVFDQHSDRTRLVGRLAPGDLFSLLRHTDLFVWPAVNEAYGVALLEAQACGVPVIAGRSGGISDIVEHEQTGLLTPPNDTGAFCAAMRSLLTNTEKRRQMAGKASAKAQTDHDIARAARTIDRVVRKAVVTYRE